jgi:CubicO group peptidase (beta-lactamase class C family)
MTRRPVLALLSIKLLLVAAFAAQAQTITPLDKELVSYRERYKLLPALAAAAVKDGRIIAAGAVGTRRVGTDPPVTLQDRFHLGSDTKAMTSLLLAMLVEEGKLRWNSTVGELYPELVGKMSPGFKDITLEQILSHTSGIPGDRDDLAPVITFSLTDPPVNLDRMRATVVERLVAVKLSAPPGQHWEYSNLGYTLAGAIAEKLTGKTWEELIVQRIFDPLKLSTAGFGPQSTMGRVDAPLGHVLDKDGKPQALLAGPFGDNPPVIGPAGTAHMSVLDFATWAAWNAMEGRIGPPLAKPETVRKLMTKIIDMPPRPDAPVGTPPPGGYAMGWGTAKLPFTPEPLVFHGGSNTFNLAYIMLQPDKKFGMVMMTNVGGHTADEALKAVAEMLYKRFSLTP